MSQRDEASLPRAEQIPKILMIHGDVRTDEYAWLRDQSDPRVWAHLEAENEYTRTALAPLEPLVETLFQEMTRRLAPDDVSVPAAQGDYEYYSRQREDQPYMVHCRRRRRPGASEEILLDENEMAEGQPYFALGALAISPNQQLLAYAVDLCGDERYQVFVKDLTCGEVVKQPIENAGPSLQWAADSLTLFYLTLDLSNRPWRLMRHRLDRDAAEDVEIYREEDEPFRLLLSKTRDGAYLLLTSSNRDSTEVRACPADAPEGPFELIEPRRPGVDYAVAHWVDRFLILTNDDAEGYRVLSAPVATPGRQHWTELVPHSYGTVLHSMEVFAHHLVLHGQIDGLRQIQIFDLRSGRIRDLPLVDECSSSFPGDNREFHTSVLRFGHSSLVCPYSVYDYDMESGHLELRKRSPVPGYNPGLYQAERILAKAWDGARVPISLVYRRDLRRPDGNPLVLYGYGAYGFSLFPDFDPARLSLLDRGVILAIAHVRGGGEMGRAWHLQGRLQDKLTSCTDFIACAEHLLAHRFARPGRMAAMGESAGGFLVGTVANLRPDLFAAIVADCPFVDVINTLLDTEIPFTPTEWQEWGNPYERSAYAALRSCSPYDNVTPQDYPAMLITGGLNDPRVPYWEPAKWAARLREQTTGDRPIYLWIEEGAGHSGPSGRFGTLKSLALRYAFLLDQLKVEPSPVRPYP